ncbi:MAG: plastocyanin/azurin family copper-binding protein [Gemmatimonadales bacterium]
MTRPRRPSFSLALLFGALSSACGGGGDGGTTPPPPPPPPPIVVEKGTPSGDGQTIIGGQALAVPLKVKVTRGGAVVVGQAITWTASGGAIGGNGPTNSEGIATANWTVGVTAGIQTANATVGTASAQFAATVLTATPGPIGISFLGATGNGQTGNVGSQLTNELRVLVTRGGAPAGGELVVWQADGANSFFEPEQTTSGADGIATSSWTLGTTAGAQAATAFAGSLAGPSVGFTATGVALPPGTATVKLYTAGGARFEPASLVVAAGTTVTFVWQDGFHDLLPTGAPTFPGANGGFDPPKTYQFTFTTPGIYKYFCSVHGSPSTGMRGTVIVQ